VGVILGVDVLGIGVKLGVTIMVGVLEGVPVATGGARLGVTVKDGINATIMAMVVPIAMFRFVVDFIFCLLYQSSRE
jgi:hypothetical protein